MTIVFGGAFQGKCDFVLENFAYSRDDIYFCNENDTLIQTDLPVICGLHVHMFGMVRRGEDCMAWLDKMLPTWQGRVIIADDISAGIVPMDAQLRSWREQTGRALALLCEQATDVYRVFYSIPTKIK